MRVLVSGGRSFSDYALLRNRIESLLPPATDDMATWLPPPDTTVIHSGCSGADALADQWSVANWVKTEVYPDDWKRYGRAAGADPKPADD